MTDDEHAAMIADRAARDWQPIDTAPRDGRMILTYGCTHGKTDEGEPPTFRLSSWWGRPGKYQGWYTFPTGGHEPTHWQPLTAPKGDA